MEEPAEDDELPVGDFPPPAAPVEEPPLEELLELDAAFVVPPPDTVSPTSPESATIVPLVGAYSFVFWTARSALCTLSLSLLTEARADARFASRVAVLCLVLDELAAGLLPADPEEVGAAVFDVRVEPPDCPPAPVPVEGLPVDFVGVVVAAGVVAAGALVLLGCVVVAV